MGSKFFKTQDSRSMTSLTDCAVIDFATDDRLLWVISYYMLEEVLGLSFSPGPGPDPGHQTVGVISDVYVPTQLTCFEHKACTPQQ